VFSRLSVWNYNFQRPYRKYTRRKNVQLRDCFRVAINVSLLKIEENALKGGWKLDVPTTKHKYNFTGRTGGKTRLNISVSRVPVRHFSLEFSEGNCKIRRSVSLRKRVYRRGDEMNYQIRHYLVKQLETERKWKNKLIFTKNLDGNDRIYIFLDKKCFCSNSSICNLVLIRAV